MDTLQQKYQTLQDGLRRMGRAAVAFSGGVDSTFLLKAAQLALGENVLAVTAVSPFFPKREQQEATAFCTENGIRQVFVSSEELNGEAITANPKNRCYLCKKALFTRMLQAARQYGIEAVVEGSNMDDLGDYRPGLQAIAELHIQSPLRAAGLTKQEIRTLSQQLGLPTWSKPSYACLASRFVYGERITAEKLAMVEQAEEYLHRMGFVQLRVRIHGQMARIELLPADFERFMQPEVRAPAYQKLKELGFAYVTLDLGGYRTGSMNEPLNAQK